MNPAISGLAFLCGELNFLNYYFFQGSQIGETLLLYALLWTAIAYFVLIYRKDEAKPSFVQDSTKPHTRGKN